MGSVRRTHSAETMRRGPTGFFLIWALLMIAFMSTLVAVGQLRSYTELTASNRFASNEAAFELAEAGIDHALSTISSSSLSWNDELAGNGVLSFGLVTSMDPGTYTVQVLDNQDERAPTPDDPTVDVDGIIHIVSTGTTVQGQRTVDVAIRSPINYAIAAQVDIRLRQASAMGDIHANGNIEVRKTSDLFGCSKATASGTFCFGVNGCGGSPDPTDPTITLNHDPACTDLDGGDPVIAFPRPDEAALRAAIKLGNWNLPDTSNIIRLPSQEVVGYNVALDGTNDSPQRITFSSGTGPSTMAVFDGQSLRVRQSLGTWQTIRGQTVCTAPLNLSIIVLDGFIDFKQPVCLRGLIWAAGDITIFDGSVISGAVVSAGGTIDVRQGSSITFNRSVIDSSLLPGFSGSTFLSWQEQ